MSYDFISKLYILCSAEAPDGAAPSYFASLYDRISDTDEADKAFNAALERSKLSRDELLTLDELEGNAICAYELQGFINGFRIGARLGTELWKNTGEQLAAFVEC